MEEGQRRQPLKKKKRKKELVGERGGEEGRENVLEFKARVLVSAGGVRVIITLRAPGN